MDLLGSISFAPYEKTDGAMALPQKSKNMLLLAGGTVDAGQTRLYQDIEVCLP